MVDEDLGEATIAYEGPDGEAVEETVENEHVAYFQDHWVVKTGENEAGHDTIRRIPAQRVYYVEREVEEFEAEVGTVLDEFQSVADELERGIGTIREEIESVTGEVGTVLLGGEREERGGTVESDEDVYHIDIGDDVPDEGEPSGERGEPDGPDDENGADES